MAGRVRTGTPYIEETVLCAVNGIAGLDEFKSNDTFQQLAEEKKGAHVTLRGDNDFTPK